MSIVTISYTDQFKNIFKLDLLSFLLYIQYNFTFLPFEVIF